MVAMREEMLETTPQSAPDVRVEMVTPEKAVAWLATDLYTLQRAKSEYHVRGLTHAIARGEFKPGAIEFCVVDGRRYLADGQHRLMAVVASETDQTFAIVEYSYPSLAEVQAHYARTDQGLKRAPSDAPAFKIFGEDLDLTATERRAVVSAMPLLAGGFDDAERRQSFAANSIDARYELALSLKSQVSRYFGIVKGGRREVKRYLNQAGVLGVALITIRDQPVKAVAFWERIAQFAGYEKETGEHHLIAYFLSPKEGHQRSWQSARWAARCWSLYFEDERVGSIRTPDYSAPIRIAGTIYDGRNVRLL